MAAVIECTVDLAADQKGVHMSRFPSSSRRRSTRRRRRRCSSRCSRSTSRAVSSTPGRPPRRGLDPRPVADPPAHACHWLATQEMVTLCGIAAAFWCRDAPTRSESRRPESTRCPCAQGLVRQITQASVCSRPGFDSDDIEKILALVPVATHNQRGRSRRSSWERGGDLDAEVLVEIAERSMSAPIYDLLEKPDELFVVEHAHLQPRFVEDSVRLRLPRCSRDACRPLAVDDFLLSKQVNFETIHHHTTSSPSASGTVGELRRGELDHRKSPAPGQTTLAAWLAG